ncbi:MAG TPA: hypothetical protein DCY35_06630 [Prolixibacteraceae bacterium]|nr:hypothetical protein [Prolixibacteraceae bacterium]
MKFTKVLTIILWVILAISAVLVVSLMVNIGEDSDPVMNSWINNNIIWTYILLAVGAGIALLAGVFQMVSDIGAAKKGLLSLGFIAVIAIVSYVLASDAIPQFIGVDKFIADGSLTPGIAKMVDAGLIATYLLFGIAVLSVVWSSVSNVFK